MEDSTIAILTRLDTVNDRVTDLSTKIGNIDEQRTRLERVESKLNEIGEGNGFSTKEFVIATSTQAANMSIEDNVEVSISEPATE